MAVKVVDIATGLKDLFGEEEDGLSFDDQVCLGDIVQACFQWAICVECVKLWSTGESIDNLDDCSNIDTTRLEKAAGSNHCMNSRCPNINNLDLDQTCAQKEIIGCVINNYAPDF